MKVDFETANDRDKTSSNLILWSKFLGGLSGFIALADTIYWWNQIKIFDQNVYHNSEDGLVLFLFFAALLIITAGFIGPFKIKDSPGSVALGQIICGILGAVLSLGEIFTISAAILLVVSGILASMVASKTRRGKLKFTEELEEIKRLLEAKNYSEATPRLFKLSRVNPDNPEVKLLFKQWREYKKMQNNDPKPDENGR
jgi:hypothetical protein